MERLLDFLTLPMRETVPCGFLLTVSLVFGKKFQYLSMTGSLESSLGNVKMVFPVNKAMALIKKIASTLGQSSSGLGSIVKLADGYDNFRLGFKMSQ